LPLVCSKRDFPPQPPAHVSGTEVEVPEAEVEARPPAAARSATFIGAFALAARVAERLAAFGLIAVIASIYGSSYVADLYFIASIGPLLIGSLLGETIAATVLPLLVRRGGPRGESLVASGLWCVVLLLLGVTLAYAGVAVLVARMAAPAGSHALGPWLAFSPIVLLLGLSGYLAAVLLDQQRYVWPPFRTAAASIGAVIFVGPILGFTHRLTFVAAGVTAGYALSCVLMLVETRDTGRLFSRPDRASIAELLGLWRKAGVSGLSFLLGGQAFVLIERTIAASAGVGAVATLSYARGIVFTPNILGQAIAAGIYPGMVRSHERREPDVVRDALLRGLRLTIFFAVSIAVYFAAFGVPLTGTLLQRGAFGSAASSETGRVLSVFALALAANLVLIFVSRVFYAVDFFGAALWCQGVVLVVYVVLVIPLREALGLKGLALAFGMAELAGALTGLGLALSRLGVRLQTLLTVTVAPALRRAAVVVAALLAYRAVVAGVGPSIQYAGVVHVGGSLFVLGLATAVVLWTARWPETERLKSVAGRVLARVR
jgi:putative peptidoglycan lipid II flippase